MNPIIEQTIYYAIVLLLGFLMVTFLQRGFFMKFLKVKISLGRLVMVKIRAVNRDHYSVGKIEDGFLIFKMHKNYRRLCIPDNRIFYRSLGVTWVDIEEEKNAFCYADYSTVTGFDADKFENLYLRTLYKPTLNDNTHKIIVVGLLIIFILVASMFFFLYKHDTILKSIVPMIQELHSGVVAAATK